MAEKIFLHLLFLCGIWYHGIIEISATEELKESSDFLIRQKRVISFVSGEDIPVRINQAPYVVRIKENGRNTCIGSILSPYVIITSASCVSGQESEYQIVSGSASINHGNNHNVTEIRRRVIDPHRRNFDGIALIIVNPPLVYNSFRGFIRLHTGPLRDGSLGKVHGWGYNPRSGNRGTNIPIKLRSIEVPIILNQNCVNRYHPHRVISEKNICTYHPQRHCCQVDVGAGLVVNNTLAGVLVWSGLPTGNADESKYPDVYANLQDSYYAEWIRINIETINLRFRNHE